MIRNVNTVLIFYYTVLYYFTLSYTVLHYTYAFFVYGVIQCSKPPPPHGSGPWDKNVALGTRMWHLGQEWVLHLGQEWVLHLEAGTRINRGRRGTAISGIWPSRSRYRENDRDNRDKWNPKKTSFKVVFCNF